MTSISEEFISSSMRDSLALMPTTQFSVKLRAESASNLRLCRLLYAIRG